jgi:lipopolysaccharide transport system ATP-binding protein
LTNLALRVESISKRYRLGSREKYRAFRDVLTSAFRAPLQLLRGGRAARKAEETLWALRDVSFDVREGEVVGIIGRNGAGKSTLLKVLSRVTEPTEGRALVRGRVASLLEVGTGFHPELTGRENVFLNGAILGMSRAEVRRKFDEIVAFAEVERFIDTPVKHYSSGMYVRLAFAVAAHLEPETLFVDEVLAVGDLQFQRKCLAKMHDVSHAGRTVLFVSHNMSAITKLCSRAILLREGRVVGDAGAAEVVAQYVSAALGGSASAEFTDPKIRPGSDGFELLSVCLMDEAGEPISVAAIERPLDLRIRYRVNVKGLTFRCAVSFHTGGTVAFATMERTEQVREETGEYTSTVRIPGNLLSEGEYTVNLSVFASRGKKSHLCKVADLVAFQVFDPMTGGSARGDYAEGYGGVVRPMLDWRLRFEGPRGGA